MNIQDSEQFQSSSNMNTQDSKQFQLSYNISFKPISWTLKIQNSFNSNQSHEHSRFRTILIMIWYLIQTNLMNT